MTKFILIHTFYKQLSIALIQKLNCCHETNHVNSVYMEAGCPNSQSHSPTHAQQSLASVSIWVSRES